jgi:hypothetical protein
MMDTKTIVLVVGSAKSHGEKHRPKIRIAGLWLEGYGFSAGTLVSGEFEEGRIILKAEGAGVKEYIKCVSDIRKKDGCLMQVLNLLNNNKRVPHIQIAALWLSRYGFNTGDVIAVYCSENLIKIVKLDIPPP